MDKLIIADAHCDTLTEILDKERQFRYESNEGHLDLPRLKRGGVKVQFFAAFIHPRFRGDFLGRALALLDVFYREVLPAGVSLVLENDDVQRALNSSRLAGVLAVEGGEALEGRVAVLHILYRLGVRSLGLTWNGRNELADGVSAGGAERGLTAFGHTVVKEMNALGMLIDLAHIAERGFWDVLEATEAPVIVSHANARSRCDHPRNLNDAQIRALAARGGVVGVTFVPAFVDSARPSLNKLLDHIEHIFQVGGPDCAALGSDFDGFDGHLPGLEHVGRMGHIVCGLKQRGYSDTDISKIMGGNILRILKEVLPRSQGVRSQ